MNVGARHVLSTDGHPRPSCVSPAEPRQPTRGSCPYTTALTFGPMHRNVRQRHLWFTPAESWSYDVLCGCQADSPCQNSSPTLNVSRLGEWRIK